ncbi:MAG: resolvase [Thermoproteota archaeon]|nr:MAG: resolvase [Candidatus Korarchaeota archaeon]
MKGVAYIRVSTREQDENNQRLAIEKFAKEEGIEILRYFVDKGESRMKTWKERPGARQMVEFLEKGGKDFVKAVVVFDFTRLGASMLDMLNLFNKLEAELGVKVLSIHDEWLRTKDESLRKLLIAIFSWMAEMEIKIRRERQQAAWEAGKQKGRPPKVKDEVLLKYYSKYGKYGTKKYVWLRLKEDGYDISYDRFLKRLKKLMR